MFPQQASERRCACRGACPEPVERVSRPLGSTTSGPRLLSAETQAARLPLQGAPVNGHACHAVASCEGKPTINLQQSTLNSVRAAFTLLELLIVIGIIALLLVLLAPAFTTIKGAGDVTSAAYTIKGVLDTARTYAEANNTYTWVGFFEEDISSATPGTAGNGRVVMSIVASKDGTTVYNPNNPGSIDATRLIQVGKLVKIDNFHLPIFSPGLSTGDTFDTRPWPSPAPTPANDSRFGEINLSGTQSAPTTNTQFPFQYPVGTPAPQAQYTFQKTLQFNPRGESTINSGLGMGGVTYNVKQIVEIGLIQTHGNVVPTPTPSAGNYVGNVAAVQITGFGGSVKIYRR
jgi:prepilin-type N-terminal cleavage/methylation domain-containing protein